MKSQHRILSLGLAGALLAAFLVPAPQAQAGRRERAIVAGALIGGTLGYLAGSSSRHSRSSVHVGYSAPLYVAPSYYYYHSPVVYSPPPVYYSPPVVYSPPPVYYSPPVVYSPSPVVYYQPSVITTSITCTRPRVIHTQTVRPVITVRPSHGGGHYNRITCPRR